MNHKHTKGRQGESLVCQHLRQLGFEIMERNFRHSDLAEIDILACRESIIWLVEVKTHTRPVFGSFISASQIKRLQGNRLKLLSWACPKALVLVVAWVKLSEQSVEFFEIP